MTVSNMVVPLCEKYQWTIPFAISSDSVSPSRVVFVTVATTETCLESFKAKGKFLWGWEKGTLVYQSVPFRSGKSENELGLSFVLGRVKGSSLPTFVYGEILHKRKFNLSTSLHTVRVFANWYEKSIRENWKYRLIIASRGPTMMPFPVLAV